MIGVEQCRCQLCHGFCEIEVYMQHQDGFRVFVNMGNISVNCDHIFYSARSDLDALIWVQGTLYTVHVSNFETTI